MAIEPGASGSAADPAPRARPEPAAPALSADPARCSIETALAEDGVTIWVHGRFDFTQHRAFRAAYEGVPSGASCFTLDLSDTEYLDTAALGMLLLLRDHAGGDRARIRVRNCVPAVREILHIASFDALFEVD